VLHNLTSLPLDEVHSSNAVVLVKEEEILETHVKRIAESAFVVADRLEVQASFHVVNLVVLLLELNLIRSPFDIHLGFPHVVEISDQLGQRVLNIGSCLFKRHLDKRRTIVLIKVLSKSFSL